MSNSEAATSTTKDRDRSESAEALPLDGVTVLSLAEQYPGPYASMLLADMGADVIMIERPELGDPARQFPVFFEAINRNKRSIAVDLKSASGREVLYRLVAKADVLLEGFRPGVAERLRVDHSTITTIKPDIIYVSVSGFGQNGPWRLHPGHDLTYQSLVGALHEHPVTVSSGDGSLVSPVGDLATGTFTVIAVLNGLLRRQQTGSGTYADLAITDCMASFLTTRLFSAANGLPPSGIPPREPAYGLFRTLDNRYIALGVAHEDPFWDSLCEALGLQECIGLRASGRTSRFAELRELLSQRFGLETLKHWDDVLSRHGIAYAPVLEPSEVFSHPQVQARDLATVLPADGENDARIHLRQPVGREGSIRHHAPRLGQHTRSVLLEAGLSGSEVNELEESGAVVHNGD